MYFRSSSEFTGVPERPAVDQCTTSGSVVLARVYFRFLSNYIQKITIINMFYMTIPKSMSTNNLFLRNRPLYLDNYPTLP